MIQYSYSTIYQIQEEAYRHLQLCGGAFETSKWSLVDSHIFEYMYKAQRRWNREGFSRNAAVQKLSFIQSTAASIVHAHNIRIALATRRSILFPYARSIRRQVQSRNQHPKFYLIWWSFTSYVWSSSNCCWSLEDYGCRLLAVAIRHACTDI